MRKQIALSLSAVLLFSVLGCSEKPTEEPIRILGGISTQYVSESAFAAIVVHPQRMFNSKTLAPIDIDFMMESMKEEFGFDLRDVEQMVVTFSLNQFGEPEPSIIFHMNSQYDHVEIRNISARHFAKKLDHHDYSYFANGTHASADCVAYPDDRRILFAESQAGMHEMLTGGGPGELVAALTGADPGHDAIAVITIPPIRDTLQQLASNNTLTKGYTDVPNQIDTIVATADLDPKPRAEVVISASSPQDAKSLTSTITDWLELGKSAMSDVRNEVSRELGGEFADKLVLALIELIDNTSPQVRGNRVTVAITAPDNVDEFVHKLAELIDYERRREQDSIIRRSQNEKGSNKVGDKDGYQSK